MKKNNKIRLWHGILLGISWITFAGLGIQAFGRLTKTIAILVAEPETASKFWYEVDLSQLYAANANAFLLQSFFMLCVAFLKAYLFYRIVYILSIKEISLSQPFAPALQRFVSQFAALSAAIGLSCSIGVKIAMELQSLGLPVADLVEMKFEGADVWIFMSIPLFIIAQIIKRGVVLQQESDLTV